MVNGSDSNLVTLKEIGIGFKGQPPEILAGKSFAAHSHIYDKG